jgi:arsenical pump membrane protein
MNAGICTISLLSIAGVLVRPWKLPEWVWAVSGSILLVLFRLISLKSVGHAMSEGIDVYLFLMGMMLLSEQARSEGLFDVLASWAKVHARGSSRRLFVLIYAAGAAVTAFLSNDATAVVMTPAVYASVKQAGAKPMPYLFACAFIANAASFVLPISNPANLVVFGNHIPQIASWIRAFGLPSLASIGVTFAVLWLWFTEDLRAPLHQTHRDEITEISSLGKLTAAGLFAVVIVLMISSFLQWDLGLPTFLSALGIVLGIATKKRRWPRQVMKDVSWSVIPLVAGLFVIVEAVNQVGALKITRELLGAAVSLPSILGKLMVAFCVGSSSNLFNNLPVGLIAGKAVDQSVIPQGIRSAVLVGIDLGPNLSVTGSLATILWLMAIRREGEKVSGFAFFKCVFRRRRHAFPI